MLIRCYGLFWDRAGTDWSPGSGVRFRLLGRHGSNLPGLRLVDFRDQIGLYILYGNYGPYYVGLTQTRGIGFRLRDHTKDIHADQWTRFSWFGFKPVLARRVGGLNQLKDLREVQVGSTNSAIKDMEAILIKAMGVSNTNDMKFTRADRWEQVSRLERDKWLQKTLAR